MPVPSVAQYLKPIAQRRRDAADQIAALKGQLRIAQGIKVLHVCSCGHPDCGQPPPQTLPADAWVVQLGCSRLAPQQVTPEAIEAQMEAAAPPTPAQQALMDSLAQLGPIQHTKPTMINR